MGVCALLGIYTGWQAFFEETCRSAVIRITGMVTSSRSMPAFDISYEVSSRWLESYKESQTF